MGLRKKDNYIICSFEKVLKTIISLSLPLFVSLSLSLKAKYSLIRINN
jgi:hypothetical protein